MYTTNELLAHPLVSPIMQPTLGGLPPLLIMTGGGEFLRDEQIYLAHKCANPTKYPIADSLLHESAQEQLKRFKPTDVQLQIWDDLCHVAPTLSFTRPAKYMYRSVAQFGAWALARAQHTDIEILDDDDISVISSSEESDSDREGASLPKSAGTEAHPAIGKAGDPLPPFKNHMIRQRVSRHGTVSALEPPTDLPACNMRPEDVGVVKEGPVRKWLEARRQWDNRFGSVRAKVQKRRLKAMMEGYNGFDGETPPPSALAGRRKISVSEEKEQKRKKSMGMALWSLWGSKHDEATMIREQEADKAPETKAATTEEGEGARSQADLKTQSKKVAANELAKGRSRSRRKVVRDDRQTTANDSDVDENTPVAVLLAKKEEKQKEREGEEAAGEPETAAALLGSEEEKEHASSGNGGALLTTLEQPDTGVTGKRPKVSGIAVPFSLNREAETASMITLTSTAEQPSRVVSPIPTSPRTPSPLAASFPPFAAEGGAGAGAGAVPAIMVGGDAAITPQGGERPPFETFVTAEEDLPRLK